MRVAISLGFALAIACDRQAPPASPSAPASVAASEPDAPAPVQAMPAPPPEVPGGGPDPLTLDGSYSTSIGNPNEGSLTGGVPLPLTGPGYRFTPRKKPERRHGTVELVAALVRAAIHVHETQPGSTLTFGDIGMPQGGEIVGHGSHRAGRDADVMFYLLDAQGRAADGLAVPLDPAGEGTDYNDLADPSDDVPLHLDVPRTWIFVAALLADERVQIQQIFIVEHLRATFIAHAKKLGTDAAIVQRFADVTCQPRFPHDDHMHVRVFCSAEDIAGGCTDVAPIYPWQRALLKAAGTAPVAPGKRTAKKKQLTSVAEARAKAGPMHADVVAFLDRREAWAKQPHPGRRYCK
ncbi:MAG: penicillin-insensitive murein endopeptidase [Deltaproteobacteria bacterium]|nr:penicillin-insensitive murein endopeptidase [Nannocystaceae bacterium]